mmetsp:Transcript_28084/g.66340  ORF Transcript_28084/g.66340 Transcript_28084/m.66340 type:complete len:256 (-) Transcript_28084:229-996(-)
MPAMVTPPSASPSDRTCVTSSLVFTAMPLITLMAFAPSAAAAATSTPATSRWNGPSAKSALAASATSTERPATSTNRSYRSVRARHSGDVTPATYTPASARSASSSGEPVSSGRRMPQSWRCQTSCGSARTTRSRSSVRSQNTSTRFFSSIAFQISTTSCPKIVGSTCSAVLDTSAIFASCSAAAQPSLVRPVVKAFRYPSSTLVGSPVARYARTSDAASAPYRSGLYGVAATCTAKPCTFSSAADGSPAAAVAQ